MKIKLIKKLKSIGGKSIKINAQGEKKWIIS